MSKLVAIVSTLVLSLGFTAFLAGEPQPPGAQPIPKAKGKGAGKKKGEREPGGELRKAYDLLRRPAPTTVSPGAARSGCATGPIKPRRSIVTG